MTTPNTPSPVETLRVVLAAHSYCGGYVGVCACDWSGAVLLTPPDEITWRVWSEHVCSVFAAALTAATEAGRE